ncbi:neutral zinc metallopeptidase [Microlunatus flavus]|uniref:Neutral zinc metallopeptidase n=1 Tax=Microlunatus flavus TaxID=1036181 RepID=A0A1H8Z9S2_9ACTN|nr:neutral zinc metallopeptidase [Microlunatus flavus]SEP60997.1 hypothetical protein SAMN05421756_101150 [Microlunatus flavus]
MPAPEDPWGDRGREPREHLGRGAEPGPRHAREPEPGRRWPVVLALVSAAVLTGLVATSIVMAARNHDRADPAAPTTATASARRVTPASAPTSPPSVPSVSPTPSPTPVPVPGTTAPTAAPADPLPTAAEPPSAPAGPNRSLERNTLYGIDLGGVTTSCDLEVRRPKPPLANKKLQPYLTEVVGCLTKAFRGPLAARGFVLETPKVKTYHKQLETPCSTFGQSGSPAYYCSRTSTIYWPDTVDDGREAYTFARLGYVGLVAHEFGHHVQLTTGMLNGYSDQYAEASNKQRYALSRRLELQAQCFEGVFLHTARKSLHVSGKDRAELKSWHSYTGDEDPPDDRKPDHGSSKAQFGWLERGLDSGDFGDCNTWSASSKSVT